MPDASQQTHIDPFVSTKIFHGTADALMNNQQSIPEFFYDFNSSNQLTCYAHFSDGRDVHLHSRRNPEAEATTQVEHWLEHSVDTTKPAFVACVGFGAFHHINALSAKLFPGSQIVIIDIFPGNFNKLQKTINLSQYESQNIKIHFCVHENLSTLRYEYRRLLNEWLNFEIGIFLHPGTIRLSNIYTELAEILTVETKLEAMDRATVTSFSDEWLQNALLNLNAITVNPGVDKLYNLFPESTAVVLGAGPSLNESLKMIKKIESHVIIICVGTALKPALKAGVVPHFIVVADSDPKVFKQFEGVDLTGTSLVTSFSVYPEILKRFPKKIFPFSSHMLPEFNFWLKDFMDIPGALNVGGTVAISAVDLAVRLGCQNIYLCGIDLAMKADGTSHASHTMYHGQKYKPCDLIEVEANNGGKVFTTKQFHAYIEIFGKYLRDLVQRLNIQVFNTALSGAKLHYAQYRKNEKLLNLKKNKITFIRENIEKLRKDFLGVKDYMLKEKYEATILELDELIHHGKNAAEICKNILEGHHENEQIKAISELEKLDRLIKKNKATERLLAPAMKAVAYQALSQTYNDQNSKDNIHETFCRNMNRSLFLYKQVYETSDWIKGILDRLIKNIKSGELQYA